MLKNLKIAIIDEVSMINLLIRYVNMVWDHIFNSIELRKFYYLWDGQLCLLLVVCDGGG